MRKTLTTLAAVTALLLTGCGGESEATDTAATTEEAQATATDVQEKLNVFFESCDWQDHGTDENPIMYSCESEEVFMLAGDKTSVKVTTESIAEKLEVPVYATITDTYSVYSDNQGKINQAWDALGADPEAKPHKVK